MNKRGLAVLYIDDDPDIRLLIRELLEEGKKISKDGLDIRVWEAGDVDQAVALYGGTQPGLILLDNRLGTETGLDLLPRVKQTWNSPVWLVTGIDRDGLKEKSADHGAAGLVLKDHLVASAEQLRMFLLKSSLLR